MGFFGRLRESCPSPCGNHVSRRSLPEEPTVDDRGPIEWDGIDGTGKDRPVTKRPDQLGRHRPDSLGRRFCCTAAHTSSIAPVCPIRYCLTYDNKWGRRYNSLACSTRPLFTDGERSRSGSGDGSGREEAAEKDRTGQNRPRPERTRPKRNTGRRRGGRVTRRSRSRRCLRSLLRRRLVRRSVDSRRQ